MTQVFTAQNVDPVLPYMAFFEALSESSILLQNNAPKYTILAASPEYIAMIGITKDNLIGKGMFEAFPSNPNDLADTGSNDVRGSLELVRLHKKPHQLPVQRYDVAGEDGHLKERYWNAINKPVFSPDGKVAFIIHTAEDITDQIKAKEKDEEHQELVKAYQKIEESQAALLESEAKFRNLFESMDQGYCTLEVLFDGNRCVDYRYLETNPAFEHHLGLKGALGKTIRELAPDIEAKWFDFYGSVALTGDPIRIEEESKALNKWFEVYAIRVGRSEDKKVGVFFTDITERKRVEVTIRQSESNLRNTILQAPVAMAILRGPTLVVDIANDAMYELWGRSSEELLNAPLFERLTELKGQGYEELTTRVFTTGERFSAQGMPINLPRNEGIDTIYINFLNEAFRESDGTISGVIVVAIDVTEQMVARMKIEVSQQELELAVDIANLGTFRLDLLTNKATNSDKLNQWFGYTVQGYSREEGFNPIHPEDREHVDKVILQTLHSEDQSRHDVTYRVIHPTTGIIRHLRSLGKTLFNEQGMPYLIIGIIQDITTQVLHQRQLEENETELQGRVLERTLDLEKLNNDLNRSNQNLEEFAYAASHDMKEPIRKINFFADRLKLRLADKLEEEDRRYFERLEMGAKRMNTLIDDLLLYSHVNRGVSLVETVDLNQMLSFVLDDLELHIEQKGAKVEISSLPTIKGRPRQLQQLFENLIANALKYSKEGVVPVVTVSSRLLNGKEVSVHLPSVKKDKIYHLIEVRDNGIGFEQADAERIFNVFTRLHGNAEYKGTGVGLSIVQKIVENHSGHIWAESKPDEGSTFNILLPVELK